MINLPSAYAHHQEVSFQRYEKADPEFGIVSAIRFTKAKVYYDILDDYRGEVVRDIPSHLVTAEVAEVKVDKKKK